MTKISIQPPDPAPVGYGARLRQHAATTPYSPAVTVLRADGAVGTVNWAELDALVDRIAHVLRQRPVRQGDVVGIGLANGLLHLGTVLACWRLGATIMTLDPGSPPVQIRALLERARAVCAVVEDGTGTAEGSFLAGGELMALQRQAPDERRADCISRPGKIVLSGGSTGIPKLMTNDQPWVSVPGRPWGKIAGRLGFRSGQRQLVCGAMSHNAPLTWAQLGLFEGQHLVVMERFDAASALRAIDAYGIQFVMTVPTMMVRMLDALDAVGTTFASLEAFYHTAAVCPSWLKKAWIDVLGADRIFEMYGSGENVGQTIITGSEWLEHPGSVGRPFETDARVYGADGVLLPAGEVGELFMRRRSQEDGTRYLDPSVAVRKDEDGFTSIGDMAWMDEEGYVYLAGRRDDVINTGGVKVHPEKVESILLSHPGVRDAVVVGASDRDWGERVHAVIELRDEASVIEPGDLKDHCALFLAPAEIPKSMTVVKTLPRDGFGKLKRRQIRDWVHSLAESGTSHGPTLCRAMPLSTVDDLYGVSQTLAQGLFKMRSI
ncbi:AMP-binding protein [Rhizobium sp. TRM95111]|uniref:AMP-binding protein n=1 Tax=Rhizobium alarense TaxID=2846851 RepID=UPI001F2A8F77|nr:AMP-binding protein [Rhizobium alarense]MCF3642769.1 AMP-binding protein [Rhizobium alarense]